MKRDWREVFGFDVSKIYCERKRYNPGYCAVLLGSGDFGLGPCLDGILIPSW